MDRNKGLEESVNEEQVSLLTVGCPIIGVFLQKNDQRKWGKKA